MLSNQGHIMSCAKSGELPDIKLKIAIQVPKTYVYSLFRVLSTLRFWKLIFDHQAKVSYKVRKGGCNIEVYFKQFFSLLRENLYIYNLYI